MSDKTLYGNLDEIRSLVRAAMVKKLSERRLTGSGARRGARGADAARSLRLKCDLLKGRIQEKLSTLGVDQSTVTVTSIGVTIKGRTGEEETTELVVSLGGGGNPSTSGPGHWIDDPDIIDFARQAIDHCNRATELEAQVLDQADSDADAEAPGDEEDSVAAGEGEVLLPGALKAEVTSRGFVKLDKGEGPHTYRVFVKKEGSLLPLMAATVGKVVQGRGGAEITGTVHGSKRTVRLTRPQLQGLTNNVGQQRITISGVQSGGETGQIQLDKVG